MNWMSSKQILQGEGSPESKRIGLLEELHTETHGVYSFPVFTERFCSRFLEVLRSLHCLMIHMTSECRASK